MEGVMKKNAGWPRQFIVTMAICFSVEANAQHPGHSSHPPMQSQKLYLQVQLNINDNSPPERDSAAGVARTLDVPLVLVTTEAPQTLDQTISLPAPRRPLKITRFLPKASLRQDVQPDDRGTNPPAVELAIVGPKQSFRRWLMAGDPERNRLSSYIGAWRFMAVKSKDERQSLWRQFETEFTRAPEIVVRSPEGLAEQRFAVEIGRTYSLGDQAGKITVKKFHPDCGMDRTTGEATNQTERRKNPAVLVEIEKGGTVDSRWIFAKFPGFAPAQGHALPYQVTLDCAVEPTEDLADFTIVAIGNDVELWTRENGAAGSRTVMIGQAVKVAGTSYEFSVAKMVASAQITESYVKDEKGKSALEVQYSASDAHQGTLWIELGHTRSIMTENGPILVSFQLRDENWKENSKKDVHP